MPITITFSSLHQLEYTATNFRSWRTTNFIVLPVTLMADLSPYFQDDTREAIRTKVQEINELVNQQDGWTILGWYHHGEVTDASAPAESGSSKIASLNKPIHLAILFPSNYNDIKDEIAAKQFTPTTGVAASNMAPAQAVQPQTTTNMPTHSSQQQSTTTPTQSPPALAQAPTVPVQFPGASTQAPTTTAMRAGRPQTHQKS